MADEGQVIRGIDWRQTFAFTHIFRSFRIAIHLSKLALGLALLLSVYFGGCILDYAWPTRARAVVGTGGIGEAAEYERISNGDDQTTLSAWRDQSQKALEEAYAQLLVSGEIVKPTDKQETPDHLMARATDEAHQYHHMDEVKTKINKDRDDAVTKANTAYADACKQADTQFTKDNNAKARDDAKAALLKDKNAGIIDAYDTAGKELDWLQTLKGAGLFSTFFQYEVRQVNGVVFEGVLRDNWLEQGGVKDRIYNFFAIGPVWLIWNHTVFFIVFMALFLLSWALFGGAISRIAAVHVARDEKISVRQAMNFAVGKLLSFASAPVIPLAIVIVIGLIVTVVSLIGNFPFIGPIVVGAFFILALVAGFIMTLVLLGTAGGFNLMYPTIAVEGSDSFDAISRSFSYVYARPWRMLFYTAVAIAYGAATYLFVHMFIWLTLVLTHHFVGMGIFSTANNTKDLFSTMWPNPSSTGRFSYTADYQTLTAGQSIGAFFMNCWVMLLVSFLGAFAISLYFSANTVIYYLMRSEVDSTEMDDVYLEQSEEEMEPALGATSTTVAVTVDTSATTNDAASHDAPPASPPSA